MTTIDFDQITVTWLCGGTLPSSGASEDRWSVTCGPDTYIYERFSGPNYSDSQWFTPDDTLLGPWCGVGVTAVPDEALEDLDDEPDEGGVVPLDSLIDGIIDRDGYGTGPVVKEWLMVRDPDGTIEATLFIDGVEVPDVVVETVDAGAGWTRAEWQAASDEAAEAGYSPAFTAALLAARQDPPGAQHIV